MSRGKVKTGQWELAICLATPPVVILAMFIFGFIFGRREERSLAQRASLMNLIPVLEQKAVSARNVLKPFVVSGGARDMSADLSLRVSDAALKYGFVIRSSNVEKQPGSDAGVWMDYKLSLTGEGTLTSLIGMLDNLSQPPYRFHAVQVSLKTMHLAAETMVSSDVVLLSRFVDSRDGAAGMVLVEGIASSKAEAIGETLGKSMSEVSKWLGEPVTMLSLKNLQNRVLYVPSTEVQAEPDALIPFRLTGVVRNGNYPVIMTDQGVFGIGDEVGGYKIEAIGIDTVTVISRGGQRESLKLYKGGGGM
jgi:hypothetical protein